MLKELQIRDFALIDQLELSFYSGFSVLSGETGAGKSIIIDALGLLLGARASLEMIRTGAESTIVSGSFSHTEASRRLLEQWGMLEDEELLLARELNKNGRNKCWINGRLATVGQLAQLRPFLVDIVGQHDSQGLLDSGGHAQLLDSYGGDEHAALLEDTNAIARQCLLLRSEQSRLKQDDRERNRRIDLLTFQIEEVTSAQLQPQEDEQLEVERSRLANLDRIRQALQFLLGVMGEDYDGRESLLNSLSSMEAELSRISLLDPSLELLTERYEELSLNFHDLHRAFRDYFEQLPADPGRLNEIELRLNTIDGLKRKYGDTVEEIQLYVEQAHAELVTLESAATRADGLQEEIDVLQKKWEAKADQLTWSRKSLAAELEEQIEKQLSDLSMGNTTFNVQLSSRSSGLPALGGKEDVEFLMAANLGEDLKPLAKIASGGELSRVMLAVKAILVEAERTPTLIFDEIDAGIGGRTAVNLGEKLQSLSEVRQVLCVTHLPVVASFGGNHYSVQKSSQNDRTAVEVTLLEPHERVTELTRMLGGTSEENITLEHARDLLRKTGAV